LGIVKSDFKTSDVIEKDLTGQQLNAEYRYLPIDTRHFKDLELAILGLFDNLDQALDAFYVTDAAGRKLDDPVRIAHLRAAIPAALGSGDALSSEGGSAPRSFGGPTLPPGLRGQSPRSERTPPAARLAHSLASFEGSKSHAIRRGGPTVLLSSASGPIRPQKSTRLSRWMISSSTL